MADTTRIVVRRTLLVPVAGWMAGGGDAGGGLGRLFARRFHPGGVAEEV